MADSGTLTPVSGNIRSLPLRWMVIAIDSLKHKCNHLFYGEFTR